MKNKLLPFCLLLTSFYCYAQDSLRTATEATYRAGLPHFFAKVRQGQAVNIAYLGGSITRAGGGWRDQTFRWFQQQYPAVSATEIMAAIGGTGSDFGAYRVGAHVLQHKPDLVFVEFAVNDQGKPAQAIQESMEGIVRQIRQNNANTDICFVYTFSKPQLEVYQRGQFPVSVSAMEAVADHYQLPSVFMGFPAVQQVIGGQMVMQGKVKDSPSTPIFSEDGVHPLNETGQKIYAETLEKHLTALAAVGKPTKRRLEKPLMVNNLENATMLSIDKTERSAGWQAIDSVTVGKPYAAFLPKVYATTDTTDYLRFRVTGNSFGIVDVVGPNSGQIVVRIDNDRPRYIDRFDVYCTYYRMHYSLISGLSPGEHQVEIRVSPAQLDKATILRKRNNTISNPGLYDKNAFFIGSILLRK